MPDAPPTSSSPDVVPPHTPVAHSRPACWLVQLRPLIRVGFVLYVIVLSTLTHWPALAIPPVVHRPDLIVHFGAYGLWTILLHLTGWTGPLGSRRSIRLGTLIAAGYALMDELTQGIPMLRRVVALDDALANLGGVLLGTLAILVLSALIGPTPKPGDDHNDASPPA